MVEASGVERSRFQRNRFWRRRSVTQRAVESEAIELLPVVSKNANELKTGAPGLFGLKASRLGSPMEARILGHEHADPALDMVGGRHRWLGPALRTGGYRLLARGGQSPQSSASREEASLKPWRTLVEAQSESKLRRLVKILEGPAGQQFAPFQRPLESAIAVGYVFLPGAQFVACSSPRSRFEPAVCTPGGPVARHPQPKGRKPALRREIPWILRGFQGRLSC